MSTNLPVLFLILRQKKGNVAHKLWVGPSNLVKCKPCPVAQSPMVCGSDGHTYTSKVGLYCCVFCHQKYSRSYFWQSVPKQGVSHSQSSVACPSEATTWTEWGNCWTTRPIDWYKCYVPCNWTGWGLKGKLASAGKVWAWGESRRATRRWGSMILKRHKSYSSAMWAAQGGRLRMLLCEQMWKGSLMSAYIWPALMKM